MSFLLDRRLITFFFLGFSCGLPLLLTLSTLTNWLARFEVSTKGIGLFALVGLPYSLKFTWAFLFDGIKVPILAKKIGHRKSWLIIIQFFLILSIILLGSTDPKQNILLMAFCALLVSFFSASQDIIVDALRVEILDDNEQAIGAAYYIYGYRIAMLIAGGGALYLSDFMSWNKVYLIMSLTLLIGMIATLLVNEPTKRGKEISLKKSVINTIKDFVSKPHWLLIIISIVFFKLPDALISGVVSKFYVILGFTNIEIAFVIKTFGFFITLIGSFVGGLLANKYGLFKILLISIILQSLSNSLFILQNYLGHHIYGLYVLITIENFSGAISGVMLVAYLSKLCNKNYSATQYALLSSVASIGRTFLASTSGYIIENIGWNNFFVITIISSLPTLIILFYLKKDNNPYIK